MIPLDGIILRLFGGAWFVERDGESQEARSAANQHLMRLFHTRSYGLFTIFLGSAYAWMFWREGFSFQALIASFALLLGWMARPGLSAHDPGVVRLLLNSLARKRRPLVIQALGHAMKGVMQRVDLSADQWALVRELLRTAKRPEVRAGLLGALTRARDPLTINLIREVYGDPHVLDRSLSHAEVEAISAAKIKLSEPHLGINVAGER